MNLHKVTFVLLVIGGLNWLLTAFDYGIGNWLSPSVANVVYIIVGLSALYEVFTHKKNCANCVGKGM